VAEVAEDISEAAVREVREETGIHAGTCRYCVVEDRQQMAVLEALSLHFQLPEFTKFQFLSLDFVSVLAFRQQHKLRRYFELSDLYFVCRMTPHTFDIERCQDEVLKCQWMKVQDLATTAETTPLSHMTAQVLLKAREEGFAQFDISMREVEMNYPDYTTSKSYKLFMKSD
jgi:8-oxo-dGTP pyrophosphatase MutT (NUDIX family)